MTTTFERVSIRDVLFMSELEVLEALSNIKIEIKELKRLTKHTDSNKVQLLLRISALKKYRYQLYKRQRTVAQPKPRQQVMIERTIYAEVIIVENEEILEKECPICMEKNTPNNMVNIPCSSIKHHLCLECATHLMKTPGERKKKCPICREDITELEVNCDQGEKKMSRKRCDVKELIKSCESTIIIPP